MSEGIENLYLEIRHSAGVNEAIVKGASLETPTGDAIIEASEMGGKLLVKVDDKTWREVTFVRLYNKKMDLRQLASALLILNKGTKEDSHIAQRAIEVALKDTGLKLNEGDGEYTYDWSIVSDQHEMIR